jgi:hypothetical protein
MRELAAFDARRAEWVSLRQDAQGLAARLVGALDRLPLLASDRWCRRPTLPGGSRAEIIRHARVAGNTRVWQSKRGSTRAAFVALTARQCIDTL